jgi:hypothetical protein
MNLTKVAGIATLSVRHPNLGSFAIPQDWADWRRLYRQAHR